MFGPDGSVDCLHLHKSRCCTYTFHDADIYFSARAWHSVYPAWGKWIPRPSLLHQLLSPLDYFHLWFQSVNIHFTTLLFQSMYTATTIIFSRTSQLSKVISSCYYSQNSLHFCHITVNFLLLFYVYCWLFMTCGLLDNYQVSNEEQSSTNIKQTCSLMICL